MQKSRQSKLKIVENIKKCADLEKSEGKKQGFSKEEMGKILKQSVGNISYTCLNNVQEAFLARKNTISVIFFQKISRFLDEIFPNFFDQF